MNAELLGSVGRLFDEVPVPAAIVGPDRRILFFNRALTGLLGMAEPPVGEYCYRCFQGRKADGSTLCSPSCRRIPELLSGLHVPPVLMWFRSISSGERLLQHQILPLERTNGGVETPGLCLSLYQEVEASTEITRALEDLSGLHQSVFRAPYVPAVPQGPRISPLSERESDVLTLLHEGLKTHEIADRLGISASTVRNHIQRVLGKLKVHNRLQAVVAARRNGWI